MASLSPLDPEEMARVIANAMQGVGTEGEREEAGMGVGGEPGEQVDSPEAGLHEARKVGDVRGEPPSSWAPVFVVDVGGGRRSAERWPTFQAEMCSFRWGGGISINDFYLFELLPLKAFLTGKPTRAIMLKGKLLSVRCNSCVLRFRVRKRWE